MPNKKIYFDEIRTFHWILIWWRLRQGYELYLFNFELGGSKSRLLRRLQRMGKVNNIFVSACTVAGKDSIDFANAYFDSVFANRLLRSLRRLYRSDNIDLVVRRELATQANRFFFMNHHFSSLSQLGPPPVCVSSFYCKFARVVKANDSSFCVPSHLSLPVWSNFWDGFCRLPQNFMFRMAAVVYPVALIFVFCLGRLFGKEIKDKQTFAAALHVQIDVEQNPISDRDHSLLIDHTRITLENTLFLLTFVPSSTTRTCYGEKQYQYRSIPMLFNWRSIVKTSFKFELLRPFFALLLQLLRFWTVGVIEARVVLLAVREYVTWNIVLEHVKFSCLVGSNREGIKQIAANVLLKGHGVSSIDYATYIGGGSLLTKPQDFTKVLAVTNSFLNFSHLLCFNENALAYHKLHSQKIENYEAIGSVYSQQIVGCEFNRKDLVEAFFQIPAQSNQRVITFFDTTFVDFAEATTNFDDCIAFYTDVLRFTLANQSYFIVLKPSKSRKWFMSGASVWGATARGRRVIELWDELSKCPRVYWARQDVQNSKLDFRMNNRIIAASDVTVTHVMSSPTAEAIGASKMGFFYESHAKHSSSAFGDIPNLIIQGYDTLAARIDELAYRTSQSDYQSYLQSYVVPTVVPDLNANAITKLRNTVIEAFGVIDVEHA